MRLIRGLRENGATWDEVAVLLPDRHRGVPGDLWRKRYQRAVAGLGFNPKKPAHNWVFHSDRPRKHLVIPDCQLAPGVPLDFLEWIGKYIAHKQPDVVVHLGDFADMHSLSSYDRGKRSGENARYQDDIDVANEGLDLLHRGMDGYEPELKVITLGNHEQRIERFVNDNPELYGALSYDDFDWTRRGWKVAPFLQPVDIDGILYAHFFPRAPNGRVTQSRYGAPNAREQVRREHQSATAGHTPGLDVAVVPAGNRLMRGVVAGSCYLHTEDYMGPQGNTYWRGIIVKHQVVNGQYNIMEVDLDFLRRKYG